LRIAQIAQPDGRQRSSLIPKCLLMITQLRDVLAAENSAIVAKKRNYRRPVLPQ
jgi:hypothetical protein